MCARGVDVAFPVSLVRSLPRSAAREYDALRGEQLFTGAAYMKKIGMAALLIAGAGCGNSVDVQKWPGYGVGQPGFGLAHGGQVFYELIHSPTGDIAQVNGWARTFTPDPPVADTLPIPK